MDSCVEASLGDLIEVAVQITSVENLLAWELYIQYDRQMLEVVDRDVRQFLTDEPGSSVFDFSDAVPNSTGLYRAAAADVSLSDTTESGAGTLALITFRVKSTGLSSTSLFREDVNGDGVIDFGPRLTAYGGITVSDNNNDDIFDGALLSGQVAVGQPCGAVAPTPNPDIIVQTPATAAPDGTPQPTGTGAPQPSTTTTTNVPGSTASPSPEATAANPSGGAGPGDGSAGSSGALSTWLIGIGVAIALAGTAVTVVFAKRAWA